MGEKKEKNPITKHAWLDGSAAEQQEQQTAERTATAPGAAGRVVYGPKSGFIKPDL